MSAVAEKAISKVLFFDVFGTVVDWRSTVTDYLARKSFESLSSTTTSISTSTRQACANINWASFAQEWRTRYYEFTRTQVERLNTNQPLPFKSIDDHHLESLHNLISKHHLENLWSEVEIWEVSLIWHRLNGWPDSTQGLTALKESGFTICTLSNGNTSLLTDLAVHANLPWDSIFSAERFGAYKPHPSVYKGACKAIGLEPGQCAMVAAHLGDLQAAKECGLQTIYIERPEEESWPAEKVDEAKRQGWLDVWVGLQETAAGGGISEVARKLGGKT